ncbi:MAG: hypothetical protein IJX78_07295 [Bacilli bacterium]|nr:hypothetical protein [Bacilli bacterium]
MRKIIIYFVFTMILLLGNTQVVKTENSPVVHYIFDKQEVKKGEEFTLTLILEQYQDLSTVQFVFNVNEELFVPVIKNNQYFVEPTLSLFETDEIYENSYLVDDGILRFVGITKGGKTYGHSSLNQVFTISFSANQDLSKIEEYFYEENNCHTILIDKWAKVIDKEVRYSEVLKVKWDIDKYTVEVFDLLPNVIDDITIVNRKSNEYKIEIISDEVNLSFVASQVIKVKIFDVITSQTIYLAKTIEVVDTTAPKLETAKTEVLIEDLSIDSDSFNYFKVSDNYDTNPNLIYKYYAENKQEIVSLNEFKKYLKTNKVGYISSFAVDSSSNTSETLEVKIKVADTTAPNITVLSDLEVIDQNVNEFSLESLITLTDSYDKNPKLTIKILNTNKTYNTYLEALKELYDITLEYYGIDDVGNETKHYQIKIKLVDTIPPSLKNVLDIEIQDEKLALYLQDHHLFEKDFIITDNFTKQVLLNIEYYSNDVVVTENSFFDNLEKGITGTIKYYAIDSYGNKSEELTQKVVVIDDTSPVITINNLKNGEKYLGPIRIDYEVTDNLKGEVTVEIMLDGAPYSETNLTELKEYHLVIKAIDSSGNETIKEITFEIVEENFFGCIDGINCAENNYAVGIIIGIVIVLIVGIVVTLEIIYVKKKKQQEEDAA